ncbi:ArsR/SmtB family transcription factor [Ornithinicoccus halotolerans]|uniref:ArsR/SmtB family transcription factor n=1 Tax=Ornithinicoccus halotolerans TaxID=1748220 RepID=UPI0012959D4E|nr:metalloregulator ArsR/SmtB family transcription factor [Ornithinicoccus halotolerans]
MDVFAALADPVRRQLLLRLATGPARVVDLAATHDISRPGVSKHLRLLGEAGLVRAERRGRERHYRLEAAALQPVVELVAALRGPGQAGSRSPRFTDQVLAGLDLEVRRTTAERTTRDRGAARPGRDTHHRAEEDSA